MLYESVLSEKMIKETPVNSISQTVNSYIGKRLLPVIKLLEKANYLINEEEAIKILVVSHATFFFEIAHRLPCSNLIPGSGVKPLYKLSEVLTLIQS